MPRRHRVPWRTAGGDNHLHRLITDLGAASNDRPARIAITDMAIDLMIRYEPGAAGAGRSRAIARDKRISG
jgi:hypothetical protein